MKFVRILSVAILCSIAVSAAFAAKKPKPAPAPLIQGYGDVTPLAKSAVVPSTLKLHHIAFDLSQGGDAAKLNAGLDAVARAVNAFALSGVSAKDMKVVVVIHGAATPIVIDDAGYHTRFNAANPNLDLLGKLTKAGVQIMVDGQSLAAQKIASDEVDSNVELTLSAAIDLTEYGEHKYVVITP